MNSFSSIRVIAAIVLLVTTRIQAANPPTTQQWIDQLGAHDPAERDAAEAQLAGAGSDVCDRLRAVMREGTPEVRIRAARAYRRNRLFHLRPVSNLALPFAAAYLKTDLFELRKTYLNQMFQIQPLPDEVLTRLAVLEHSDDLRRMILYQLGTGYRESVSRLIADDQDTDAVVLLLNEAATMWGRQQAADDAMALYLTGGIDDQIAIARAEQINGDAPKQERAAARLCYLYRVCGKYDQALQFARIAHEPSLIFLVLQDEGDWAAAAKEPDDRWRDPVITAGFHATFQRLAGHRAEGLGTMALVSNQATPDDSPSFTPSRYFLLNDMPARGIELLTPQHPAVSMQMHVLRGEIAGALSLADQYANHPQEGEQVRAIKQSLLISLGELPEPKAVMPIPADQVYKPWQDAVGDLHQKHFQKAADEFAAMWEKDHTQVDRLYLRGYAMKAAGRAEQGDALIRQAELIPLGDPMARWRLAGQLELAGLNGEAEQQRQLALRGGGDFDELGFSEIFNTRAQPAIDQQNWASAAEAVDRLCLVNLSAQLHWTDESRLLTIPALAHLLHARAAREHHDLALAMEELKAFELYEPCSSDMVLEWTPAMDAMGEHAAADEAFNRVYEQLAGICEKFPKSVAYQNELAWMCACCGRKLDEALRASEATVRLSPDNYAVLDTLAEVHFRRGDRSRAVELEKRAKGMTDDPYVARQLARFENAAIPSATQPSAVPK